MVFNNTVSCGAKTTLAKTIGAGNTLVFTGAQADVNDIALHNIRLNQMLGV